MALDLPREELIDLLSTGQIHLTGQFAWGSNHTFLADVTTESMPLQAVYKPAAGERPLWDFQTRTLAQREVAAYLTSQALGWELVPPTVLRGDGPAGGGSLQLYLEIDPERHYFNLDREQRQLLRPAALFDVLINNADRKGGHVLLAPDQHVWLIDHGVCFHEEYKLRTVIWDFAGQPIDPPLLEAVRGFAEALTAIRHAPHDAEATTGRQRSIESERSPGPSAEAEQQPETTDVPGGPAGPLMQLTTLLNPIELAALEQRAENLLEAGCFPTPGPDRHYPWPLV